MNARSQGFQYTKNLNYNKISVSQYEEAIVLNHTKGSEMMKLNQKFPVGTVVRFCDRDFVFDATVVDASIPGQISVVDKKGFIHIGKIHEHDEYDAIAMTSPINKYKAGYNPEKMGAEPLVQH